MKSQSYMDKALRSSDPRYARILSKLGYGTRHMTAEAAPKAPQAPKVDEATSLRAEYERVIGKRPYMGWDADTLRAKIAAAQSEG